VKSTIDPVYITDKYSLECAMVFARGLFFKRKTSKRARQKNARAFSAACGSQRIIMGKIKSGFEGILEGKKETFGVLGFRDSIQEKKDDEDDEDFERY